MPNRSVVQSFCETRSDARTQLGKSPPSNCSNRNTGPLTARYQARAQPSVPSFNRKTTQAPCGVEPDSSFVLPISTIARPPTIVAVLPVPAFKLPLGRVSIDGLLLSVAIFAGARSCTSTSFTVRASVSATNCSTTWSVLCRAGAVQRRSAPAQPFANRTFAPRCSLATCSSAPRVSPAANSQGGMLPPRFCWQAYVYRQASLGTRNKHRVLHHHHHQHLIWLPACLPNISPQGLALCI